MAIIENMTEENIERMKELVAEMQTKNPDISMKVMPMEQLVKERFSKTDPIHDRLDKIEQELTSIKDTLNHIFAGHVLINGEFIQILSNVNNP